MRFVTSSLAALLVLLGAVVGVGQIDGSRPRGKSYVTTDVVPTLTIAAGQTAQAELRFRVNPGYHVNSHTPGSDLLIPTTLQFKPLEKIKAGKIVYPPGQQLALQFSPKDKLDVYSGDIVTRVPVIVAKGAAVGQYSLKAEYQYQACNDNSCFPPKTLPVEITVIVKSTSK
jgi:DsbC/DsbD-like thiol-disulfide interchange protein